MGGCAEAVRALQETVVLSLVYPEVLAGLNVPPPKGVLLYGPPGTGKTLCAKVLAGMEYPAADGPRRLSFFSCTTAECLTKYLGEGERHLRKIFQDAKEQAPSIIFLDEVDGFAPGRSDRTDSNHRSLVTMLLGLMDGLSGRGDVVVLGATNRVDAVDPALRRPGRFDREVRFVPPDQAGRRQILRIFTRAWSPPPPAALLDDLAARSPGYVGADLRGVCTEATVRALRRKNAQLFAGGPVSRPEPVTAADVTAADWDAALAEYVPSGRRPVRQVARPLPARLEPLLGASLQRAVLEVAELLPEVVAPTEQYASGYVASPLDARAVDHHRRLLLCGTRGSGQEAVASALLARLVDCAVHVLDFVELYASASPGATDEQRLRPVVDAACASEPAVLYVPQVDQWHTDTAKCLWAALDNAPLAQRLLVVGTAVQPWEALDAELAAAFGRTVHVGAPTPGTREMFFTPLLESVRFAAPRVTPDSETSDVVKADATSDSTADARQVAVRQYNTFRLARAQVVEQLVAVSEGWRTDVLDTFYVNLSYAAARLTVTRGVVATLQPLVHEANRLAEEADSVTARRAGNAPAEAAQSSGSARRQTTQDQSAAPAPADGGGSDGPQSGAAGADGGGEEGASPGGGADGGVAT